MFETVRPSAYAGRRPGAGGGLEWRVAAGQQSGVGLGMREIDGE